MPVKRKREIPTDANLFSLRFWTSVMKELGIPAFIVFFFTMMFLFFATSDQKKAFIDKFFLFKDIDDNPYPFTFVVLALVLIVVLQYIYYKKILKVKEDENRRLGEEKTDLQERLLKKRLNSSQ